MVKQFRDELFEYVWLFVGVPLKGTINNISSECVKAIFSKTCWLLLVELELFFDVSVFSVSILSPKYDFLACFWVSSLSEKALQMCFI